VVDTGEVGQEEARVAAAERPEVVLEFLVRWNIWGE